MKEGIAQEREANLKKLLDSARSMIADGLSPDKVALYTGLSLEQIDDMIGH